MKVLRQLLKKNQRESLEITNITERQKQQIIGILNEHYDFVVEDVKDSRIIINNLSQEDIEDITNLLDRTIGCL